MRTTLEVDRLCKDKIGEYQANARQYQLWKSSRSHETLSMWQKLIGRVRQGKQEQGGEGLPLLRDLATAESDTRH
jgi:hypothetical protein